MWRGWGGGGCTIATIAPSTIAQHCGWAEEGACWAPGMSASYHGISPLTAAAVPPTAPPVPPRLCRTACTVPPYRTACTADTSFWDPATDPLLPACYDAAAPGGKALCKRFLQQVCDTPLAGTLPAATAAPRPLARRHPSRTASLTAPYRTAYRAGPGHERGPRQAAGGRHLAPRAPGAAVQRWYCGGGSTASCCAAGGCQQRATFSVSRSCQRPASHCLSEQYSVRMCRSRPPASPLPSTPAPALPCRRRASI